MKNRLAVDWGTSNLRVYLVDQIGEVTGYNESDLGLRKAREYGFEKALRDTAGTLLNDCDLVLMSGMVGAREGWAEAPYLKCPCKAKDMVSSMTNVPMESFNAMIAPGVKTMHGEMPDVMRGEETQVFGAIAKGYGDGMYVLPGTHSKWVKVQDGCIVDFTTFMTGDVYQAIRNNTVLGMDPEVSIDFQEDALRNGVREGAKCDSGGDLLSLMFTSRTLRLFNYIDPEDVGSYLGGMLVGAEVAHCMNNIDKSGQTYIIGNEGLTARYSIAGKELGVKMQPITENIAVAGLMSYSM